MELNFLDYIFVYGGLNKTELTGWTGDCFSITDNKWTTRAGMRMPRKEFAMVSCKSKYCQVK